MTNARIDDRDKEVIVGRVQAGETLQSIADDYDFTREWVRRIALDAGVTPSAVRAQQRINALAAEADEIVEGRELWRPPMFSRRSFSEGEFVTFLAASRPDLLIRWRAAQKLPLSRSGHANPHEQRCTTCHEWKPWSDFYSDSSRPLGKSVYCSTCARSHMDRHRGSTT